MSLPALEIDFTAGDRLPQLNGAVKDTDLTGCAVTLTLARPEPDGVLTKTATLDSETDGTFHFEWSDGDIVAGEGQEAVIRLTDSTGLVRTLLRFIFNVQELPTS